MQVTEGGTPEAPAYNFAFSGLKGESAGGGGGKVYRHSIYLGATFGSSGISAIFDFYDNNADPIDDKSKLIKRVRGDDGARFFADGVYSDSPSGTPIAVRSILFARVNGIGAYIMPSAGFDFQVKYIELAYLDYVSDNVQEMP